MLIDLYIWLANKFTYFLVLQNPIFIKLFQCCSFCQIAGMTDYNSNAPYCENEIDYDAIYKYDVTLGNIIGSGMISIVFDATFNGNPVVVKVKRKGIDNKLIRGCYVIQQIISVLKWLKIYMFSFELAFDQNLTSILDQLDYHKEVGNQNRYKRLYSESIVPTVIEHDDNVIIMTKMINHDVCDKTPYAESLVRLSITSILFGFMHADLHSGNIMLMPNNKIGVIDFGIMINLDGEERSCIISLLMSMNSEIYENISNVFLDKLILYSRKLTETERHDILVAMNIVTKNIVTRSGKGINVSDLNELNKIIRVYDASLKPFVCRCMLGLIAVESVLTELEPNWSPLIFRCVKSISDEITSLYE